MSLSFNGGGVAEGGVESFTSAEDARTQGRAQYHNIAIREWRAEQEGHCVTFRNRCVMPGYPLPDADARPDDALVAAANHGDERAFVSLYHRYRDWALRLA